MTIVSSSSSCTSTDAGARSEASESSLWDRVRTVIERARQWLRSDTTADNTTADGGAPQSDPTTTLDLDRFPDRAYPLTYPGREVHGINAPDVVGIETADGLRLSIPENPDSTIVSDQWVTVER